MEGLANVYMITTNMRFNDVRSGLDLSDLLTLSK